MFRLLQIELIKLRTSRVSKVLIVGYFGLLLCIALIAAIKFDIGLFKFHLADQGIFNFPYIWHFNTFVASWLKLFLAVIIVSMMSSEYSNKTLKQNLIDGLSKKEFILSKFLTVLLFSVVSVVFVFAVSLVLGLIYSDYDELGIIFSDLQYFIGYFVKLVGFFSFCLFLGILVKRSAFALGFLILWQVVEGITAGLLYWKAEAIAPMVTRFYPLNAMSNLIKEPGSRLGAVKSAANQLGEEFTKNYDVQTLDVIIVLAWTALFIYGSYAILKQRDL
ncbi:MAG TPA: ABC transporter permease [Flavobacteriaceae bacterium]|nr:ABC transporter permease [Flavobacteriaceae bacterium]MCB9212388.1 ABC transporter permease [Alteromonas sp.]HPF11664.1 ABC transporter permease [Flavobacteriaceae bacterium]HQU20139.1 ABC transporter permease [Flavobacteriaceae bacterium]HQU64772.1 ABC transporter permease [Flavobacteriaceae bacterium]